MVIARVKKWAHFFGIFRQHLRVECPNSVPNAQSSNHKGSSYIYFIVLVERAGWPALNPALYLVKAVSTHSLAMVSVCISLLPPGSTPVRYVVPRSLPWPSFVAGAAQRVNGVAAELDFFVEGGKVGWSTLLAFNTEQTQSPAAANNPVQLHPMPP